MILVLVVAATAGSIPRSDEIGDIDAVVVLGGGSGERVALGLEIAREHAVPLVLAGDAAIAPPEGVACDVTTGEVRVSCLRPDDWSTAGEARATADLASSRGWGRVAVSTSTFHVNRARILFAQCLGRANVDVVGAHDRTHLAGEVFRRGRELVGSLAAVSVQRAC